MKTLEKTYNKFLLFSFAFLNPFKKAVITTQCQVHKFINIQALNILKTDKYLEAYDFFNQHIHSINEGAVWADQDFKSSHHFYNPHTHKGLYGRKNALDLGKEYYDKSLALWKVGEFDKSMFYFGAAVHLLQDMTVPQHANIRLLDNHRQYENFVRKTYKLIQEFKAESVLFVLDTIEEFMRFNARVAMKIYKRFSVIEQDENRYYKITRCSLPLAERSTAGCMLMFYGDLFGKEIKPKRRIVTIKS